MTSGLSFLCATATTPVFLVTPLRRALSGLPVSRDRGCLTGDSAFSPCAPCSARTCAAPAVSPGWLYGAAGRRHPKPAPRASRFRGHCRGEPPRPRPGCAGRWRCRVPAPPPRSALGRAARAAPRRDAHAHCLASKPSPMSAASSSSLRRMPSSHISS